MGSLYRLREAHCKGWTAAPDTEDERAARIKGARSQGKDAELTTIDGGEATDLTAPIGLMTVPVAIRCELQFSERPA